MVDPLSRCNQGRDPCHPWLHADGAPGDVPLDAAMSIGVPVVAVEATSDEWARFAPVDRRRGDSLLGIAWGGDAPLGW
jgi:hypothetical protein